MIKSLESEHGGTPAPGSHGFPLFLTWWNQLQIASIQWASSRPLEGGQGVRVRWK